MYEELLSESEELDSTRFSKLYVSHNTAAAIHADERGRVIQSAVEMLNNPDPEAVRKFIFSLALQPANI